MTRTSARAATRPADGFACRLVTTEVLERNTLRPASRAWTASFAVAMIALAVGIVGGATRVHPTAQVAMKILGAGSAAELAEVMACVGLAQNLAAIKALATHGIQRGHMRLHARQVALAAGATGSQVQAVADRLVHEGTIRVERARELILNYELGITN